MSGVSAEQAKRDLEYYLEDKPRANETWYCIPQQWWTEFRRFAGLDESEHTARMQTDDDDQGPALDPIDASSLAAPNGFELRKDMLEHRDYTWVSQDVYNHLVRWFGVKDGSPEFARAVIEVGMMAEARIEMFPPFIKSCTCTQDGQPDMEKTKIWQFSSQDCLNDLVKQHKRDSFAHDVRLWRRDESSKDGKDGKLEANGVDGSAEADEAADDWDPFGVNKQAAIEEAEARRKQAEEDARILEEDRRLNGVTEANSGAAAAAAAAASGEAAGDDAQNADDANADGQDGNAGGDEEDDEENDGWVLCSRDELRAEFEHWATGVDLITNVNYMIEELEDEFGSWTRKTPAEKWRKELKLQEKLDVFDSAVNRWYKGTVIELDGNRVKMHYDGYHSKYDEWFDKLSSDRIAVLGTHTISRRSYGWSTWSYYRDKEGKPSFPGAVGLENLGNTCFMNSVVQCMCHVPFLAEYFARGRYRAEINRDNPLGWNGKVADAWGEHVKKYWSSKYYVVAPTVLKRTIAEVQPRFSGWNQQDSSEFLQFLLDGLHEDLNRIKEKPYTQTVESNGRPDEEVAAEAWKTHLLRNDSVIVDRVQGQLKSRVECPDCGRVSVTFDPYMFLSVPLPSDPETHVACVIVPNPKMHANDPDPNRSKVKVYRITAPKIGSIRDLKSSCADVVGIDPSRLIVADIYRARNRCWNIYKVYADYEQLAEIRRDDRVYVFEAPSEDELRETFGVNFEKFVLAPINHREWRLGYNNHYNLYFTGVPLVTRLPVGEGLDATKVRSIIADVVEGYSDLSLFDAEHADEIYGGGLDDDDDEDFYGTGDNKEDNPDGADNENAENGNEQDDDGGKPEKKKKRVRPAYGIAHMREDRFNYLRCNQCSDRYCNGCYLRKANVREHGVTITDEAYGCNITIDWEVGGEKCFDHVAFERPEEDVSMKEDESEADNLDSGNNLNVVDLASTLDEFTKSEILSATDAWYCRECGEHKQASKKFDIWSLPDVLIIHLKRFQQNGEHRDKDETPVTYPVVGLDLSKWVVNEEEKSHCVYDLVGVSIHMGGLGGGHYVAFVRNLVNGTWQDCNDDSVSPIDENIVTRHAYVLFYKRRNRDEVEPNAPPIERRISFQVGHEQQQQENEDDASAAGYERLV